MTYLYAVEESLGMNGPWAEIAQCTRKAQAQSIAEHLAEVARYERSIKRYRVRSLITYQEQFELVCMGWDDPKKFIPYCDSGPFGLPAQAVTKATWYAGFPIPPKPTPDGWHSPTMCAECYAKEMALLGGTE